MMKGANKRGRNAVKVVEKTDEELELEELLFGKDIINDKSHREEEEVEILIDTAPTLSSDKVWHDEEDEDLEVDLTQTNRLKKLRKSDEEATVVTSDKFSNALKERFQTRKLDWAKVEDTHTKALTEDRGLDEDDLALLHQSNAMVIKTHSASAEKNKNAPRSKKAQRKVANYIDDTAAPYLPLPAGQINIKRLVNANIAEPSKQRITAVDFHPTGDLLLVAGEDKHMRFFKIDGEKNEKQLSVRLNDMSIQNAVFRKNSSGSEVLACGRKPFFYSYDTVSGNVAKIPGPAGRGVKSLEHLAVSPEGSLLAFRGASGYVHLCSGASKQWAMEVKMNTAVRSHCFLDEMTLATSGVDADVYIWDLRKTGRCVARFPHDDGTATSHLSAYSPSSTTKSYNSHYTLPKAYLSVGAESGVVSLFGADRDAQNGAYDFFNGTVDANRTVRSAPKQLKSLLNLTTQITSSVFHPSGQIAAIASNQKQNQLKLVHVPSMTVFTNWPTAQSPFQRVECMAFSPNTGGFFAVGNNTGKVLLYQIAHFGAA
mmetsp:Transcript_27975/g.47883  ORF Transcript_27975/g.47883 Transcript_27975/m.47883 type:complete len:541 (-) Transcript_27975:91-1713(-)